MDTHNEKKIKGLPQDPKGDLLRNFKANGTNYHIKDANDTMGIKRLNVYTKFRTMLAFNLENFQGLFDQIVSMETNLSSALSGEGSAIAKLAANIQTLKDSIKDFSEQKYSISMLLCTLFIVREDEDLTDFDMGLANNKIEDWSKEGYRAADFFALALNFSDDYKNVLISSLGGGKNV